MEEQHYEQVDFNKTKNNCGAKAIVLTENGMCLTAFWSRLICGYNINEQFEPIHVMENILPIFDPSFNYEIIEKPQWKYNDCLEAFYNPFANKIIIRSDVYEGALTGNAMDIITIAHEVMHCIQSIVMKFLNAMNCIDFKTEFCKANSKEMQQHEIQTDKITALVLSPEFLTQGKSEQEILQDYFLNPLIQLICGIIKMSLKSLKEVLKNQNYKEVERCAV